MIAWLRRYFRTRRDGHQPAVSVDDPAHTAQRDELKQRTHDAASRLHVLEWQADVASGKFRKKAE